jgi:hypothetical protein
MFLQWIQTNSAHIFETARLVSKCATRRPQRLHSCGRQTPNVAPNVPVPLIKESSQTLLVL